MEPATPAILEDLDGDDPAGSHPASFFRATYHIRPVIDWSATDNWNMLATAYNDFFEFARQAESYVLSIASLFTLQYVI